ARPSPVEVELDHRTASGQTVPVDSPSHPPEENDRIELAGSRIAECPACPPSAEDVDDTLELPPRASEGVFHGPARLAGVPLDDAHPFQTAQAFDEQCPRDAGETPVELVEVAETREQLANDQQSPAVGEDFRRSGNRTVLTVQVHGLTSPRDP